MFYWELKKILFKQKGFILIIIALFIQIIMTNATPYVDRLSYQQVLDKTYQKSNVEKKEIINDYKETLLHVKTRGEEQLEKLSLGSIGIVEYEKWRESVREYLDYERISDSIDSQLLNIQEIEGGELLVPGQWDSFFIRYNNINFPITIAIIIISATLFTVDHEYSIYDLFSTTKNVHKRLRIQLCTIIVLVFFVSILSDTIHYIKINEITGLDYGKASIQSCYNFRNFPIKISLYNAWILCCLIHAFGSITISVIVIFLATHFKDITTTFIISFIFVVIPEYSTAIFQSFYYKMPFVHHLLIFEMVFIDMIPEYNISIAVFIIVFYLIVVYLISIKLTSIRRINNSIIKKRKLYSMIFLLFLLTGCNIKENNIIFENIGNNNYGNFYLFYDGLLLENLDQKITAYDVENNLEVNFRLELFDEHLNPDGYYFYYSNRDSLFVYDYFNYILYEYDDSDISLKPVHFDKYKSIHIKSKAILYGVITLGNDNQEKQINDIIVTDDYLVLVFESEIAIFSREDKKIIERFKTQMPVEKVLLTKKKVYYLTALDELRAIDMMTHSDTLVIFEPVKDFLVSEQGIYYINKKTSELYHYIDYQHIKIDNTYNNQLTQNSEYVFYVSNNQLYGVNKHTNSVSLLFQGASFGFGFREIDTYIVLTSNGNFLKCFNYSIECVPLKSS